MLSRSLRALSGESANHPERLAIVGGGAIARGLATVAAAHGRVLVCTRTPESADEARDALDEGVEVTCTREDLAECTFVVESIVEDHDAKAEVLRELDALLGPDAVLATTTSSLSVEALAAASGRPDRFVGLHVFNPVPKMELVELVYPDGVAELTRARARAFCEALGKTAIEVPDTPGFVVNRLLFPFLFEAVELLERTGLEPAAIDECMRLGVGHPLGPLALLDLVGLDVAQAIGRTIDVPVPARVDALVTEGALGRKSGRGLYSYDT